MINILPTKNHYMRNIYLIIIMLLDDTAVAVDVKNLSVSFFSDSRTSD